MCINGNHSIYCFYNFILIPIPWNSLSNLYISHSVSGDYWSDNTKDNILGPALFCIEFFPISNSSQVARKYRYKSLLPYFSYMDGVVNIYLDGSCSCLAILWLGKIGWIRTWYAISLYILYYVGGISIWIRYMEGAESCIETFGDWNKRITRVLVK